jgi:hypothetical protein
MNLPEVEARHHADTGTWSYVVSDPATKAAAIIDPVLDYEQKGARTSTASHRLCSTSSPREAGRCAGSWRRMRTPTTCPPRHGCRSAAARRSASAPASAACRRPSSRSTGSSRLPHRRFAVRPAVRGWRALRAWRTGSGNHRDAGHTSDSLSYRIGDAVFVGDSIFMPDGGTARCDFPGGDAQVLFASIQRLYSLPDATRVFVCHDYGPGGREVRAQTTIGEQKNANIHVRAGTAESEFVDCARSAMPPWHCRR